MGRRGRARQQPDENCGLANETIVSQTKSRVTLSFRFLFFPVRPVAFFRTALFHAMPESTPTMVCARVSKTIVGVDSGIAWKSAVRKNATMESTPTMVFDTRAQTNSGLQSP